MMDGSDPEGEPVGSIPKIVTLGGGHGQSAVLAALRQIRCRLTAVISVADDGGCSGRLRSEIGMPPPGDLRRCLLAIAQDHELAQRFSARIDLPTSTGRSVGNLALAWAYRRLGSLQAAIDWAGAHLRCVGRVAAASEAPGVVVVYDRYRGTVEGEQNVELPGATPMVAVVDGADQANPVAVSAVDEADLIVMGPGSFFTSTLSAVVSANLAGHICRSAATKLYVANIDPEGSGGDEVRALQYERMLADHLTIASRGDPVALDLLRHDASYTSIARADGTRLLTAPIAKNPTAPEHDPDLLVQAFAHHFGLTRGVPVAPEGVSEDIDRTTLDLDQIVLEMSRLLSETATQR